MINYDDTANAIRRTAIAVAAIIMMAGGRAMAQQFKIEKCDVLKNDISAFVNPVHDLNDEACAILKVVAGHDFAFSTPLGIVKRSNEVGEIWLYLPRGSKQITIKHPEWGVIRNYRFKKPLESHLTYEMIITEPKPETALIRDTVVLTKTITDTITVRKRRPKVPWTATAMATAAFHKNGPSWGVMLAAARRHGLFIHAQTDFRSIGTTQAQCNKEGFLPQSPIKPYYTGKQKHANYTVTAGLVHRIWRGVYLFEGAGYGKAETAWQLADSEGGGYALNNGLTHKGMAAEIGAMACFGRVSVAAAAVTVKGKQWQMCIGIGFKIGKQ